MVAAIDALETRLGVQWTAIRAAQRKTEEVVAKLTEALREFEDDSFSVVVTGSLGRREATEGSDADWIFLVDGRSDPEYDILARKIGRIVLDVMPKDVGRTGTFGGIVSSHELVHYIAGTRDSNENLTRRILLLAESRAWGFCCSPSHAR